MQSLLRKMEIEAGEKFEENIRFRNFLKEQDAPAIDTLVIGLNEEVSAGVDCTACGNCCRQLMINLENADVERLCAATNQTAAEFKEYYVECSSSGNLMVMNTIPCKFLTDDKCTVYTHRPQECRNFPGLDAAGFQGRMFATFMHYGRCPIIYEVLEKLKAKTGFSKDE